VESEVCGVGSVWKGRCVEWELGVWSRRWVEREVCEEGGVWSGS